jgi:peptide-methionine (S)-S-oxide reductase
MHATFGAGPFLYTKNAFKKLEGVIKISIGYAGGFIENPSYEEVSKGDTGHAEVVQIEYDPNVITYEELLDIFWSCHNPTTHNRQGKFSGSQFRSVIFVHNKDQDKIARNSKFFLEKIKRYTRKICTEIIRYEAFYEASVDDESLLKHLAFSSN